MMAVQIALSVRERRLRATDIVARTLDRIRRDDPALLAVTRTLDRRAMGLAAEVDRAIDAGRDPGPLAGVPFGAKDLFDLEGEVTTAGSTVLAKEAPQKKDAALVSRLIAAGAIPVATTNMDEFAYGFATDNAHYGITRNPHDVERLAGGSSGGSAAGVAGGLFSIGLGSDTNGSIRVPASLCGVWGLRATQGRLPTAGSYPFANSLDTVGPFTASLSDMHHAFEALDAKTMILPDTRSLRVAQLGGWFRESMSPAMARAIENLVGYLKAQETVDLPGVANARAASFVITAAEGGALHLDRLRHRAAEYDPAVRDRLLAGALLPASLIHRAHRLRHWFRRQIHAAFEGIDVLIAPAVPGEAPRIDSPLIEIGGRMVSARANLGLFTQPLTLAGFPILAVPLRVDGLPLGAQLIAKPGREDVLFALGERLEKDGMTAVPKASVDAA